MRLGFVGVGAISQAMVEAICTGPRAGAYDIVLSPRSHDRSRELADRFPEVRVAADNQSVLDESDIVFIGVLPPQFDEVVSTLTFREDHIVGSLVAGMPPSVVAPIVAPAIRIAQLIPLPAIALHVGPIVVSPAITAIVDVLEGCGDVIELEDESQIRILSVASATMSSFLQYQVTAIEWAVSAGLDVATARDYMASLYTCLAVETAHTELDAVTAMPGEHETPGGLNAYLRDSLTSAGFFSTMTASMNYLMFERNLAKIEATDAD